MMPISRYLRNKKKELLLAAAASVLTAVIFEFTVGRVLPFPYQITKYGWHPPAHTTRQKQVLDSAGDLRTVTNTYFEHGFKRWGKIDTPKKKILILGDSFTEMTFVSNGEEWFSYLEKHFDVELFVYGTGGYGSLQEFMILENHLDEIHPDMIIWQFCESNDYINNLYELGKKDFPNIDRAHRPYLENGEVVYRLAAPFASLRERSFVAALILKAYDSIFTSAAFKKAFYVLRKKRMVRRNPEEKLKIQRLSDERAYAVTLEILKKAKARAGGIPIYFFDACVTGACSERKLERNGPARERNLCTSAGLQCLPDMGDYVCDQAGQGRGAFVSYDKHWNKEGNRLVGEKFVETFKALKRLNPKTPDP